MSSARYVIIGAGFAGAATAYHLARKGATEILILEQEGMAGVHSSGRNAAMVRQVVSDPALVALTKDGAAFLRNLPAGWPVPVTFQQSGSLLLGSGEGWKKLSGDAGVARQTGIEVECWSAERTKEFVPVLKDANFDGGVWCPTDGVVDIHALLAGFLKSATSAGVEIRYHCSLRGIEVKDGTVTGVATDNEVIKTERVINAGGAWAGAIGKLAGAVKVPLHPCRRHLFVTAPLPWVDRRWPFVWDLTHDIYFRPEAGGLLLCPCDQDEMAPGIPPTDGSVNELLAEKVTRFLPTITGISIKRSWAGLRTLTADGRFVIGEDPRVKGFFWVAGLGGHGVTVSSSIGAVAASLILEEDEEGAEKFSPKRFLT
ncbi:MAG: NAD(P)/FAD-dependent oxidoreductase [Candidatus Binatia bacterium]